MQNIFVKPAIGKNGEPLLVRDVVDMQPLNPDGAWKPRNGYWLDRIRDGDVIEAEPDQVAGKKKRRPRAQRS